MHLQHIYNIHFIQPVMLIILHKVVCSSNHTINTFLGLKFSWYLFKKKMVTLLSCCVKSDAKPVENDLTVDRF